MKPDTKGRSFFHKKLWALFFIVMLLAACGRSAEVPQYLIGVWVSDHARFKNCYLHITADSMTYGQSGGTTETYVIRKVSIKKEKEVQVLKIESVSNLNIDYTTEFLFSPENGGLLKFKNKGDVEWYRQSFSMNRRINNAAIFLWKGYINYG